MKTASLKTGVRSLFQKLSFATKEVVDRSLLQIRRTAPQSLALTRDGLADAMLALAPGMYSLDISPTRSASAANGYLILSNQQYFDLLDEMYETDEVLRMCLDLIVAYMLMRPQGTTVHADDAEDSRSEDMINFFDEKIVNNPDLNFGYMIWSLALGILLHGRSTIEIIWKVDEETGFIIPEKFYHCHPGQFSFDRAGRMKYADTQIELEHYKYMTAANHALYDNPFGKSELFPFRYKWQYKKRVLVAKLQYLERFGTPIVHGTVPDGVMEKEEVMNAFINAIENLQDGMGIVTAHGEEIKVHQRASSGLGGSDGVHDSIISLFDSYFIRALLGAELTTGIKEKGARSLGEVHERTVLNKILPFAKIVCSALNNGLFEPCRQMNFGPQSPRVRYFMDTEESTDAKDARDTLKSATENGVPVTVRQAQEMLGIEAAVGDEPLLKKTATVIDAFLPRAKEETNGEDKTSSESVELPDEDEIEEDEESLSQSKSRSLSAYDKKRKQAALTTKKVFDDIRAAIDKVTKEKSLSSFQDMRKQAVKDSLSAINKLNVVKKNRETKFSEFSFGCAMLELSDTARLLCADYIVNRIDEDDLFVNDDGSLGAELDTHLTVLYGLLPEVTTEQVESAVAGEWWQWVWVQNFEVFEKDDCDVLVMKVELTPELQALRDALLTLPNEVTYPDFKPHITLAYLKKGTASKYVEDVAPLEGWLEAIDWLTYSDANGATDKIALTGDYIEMNCDTLKGAKQFAETIERTAPVSRHDLWTRLDAAGSVYRSIRMSVNREAEKLGRKWEADVTAASIEDTRSQLLQVLKDTSERLHRHGEQNVAREMKSDVVLNALDIEPTARRIVLSMFMIRQFVARQELEGIDRKPPRFAEETSKFADDDILDLLPDGFKDAADWMATRGVMTVSKIKEIARIMQEQFGGELHSYEVSLREHYFSLAATAETGVTKKIQNLIEQAVKNGQTLADFLGNIEGLVSDGDLPAGLESYWETVFRTEVGNAYKQAQLINESDPDFEPYHWGWEGFNPNDDRSDPTHAAIDGKKFKKGSVASASLGLPPWRYNCRCSLFALTMPDPDTEPYKESSNALSVAANVSKF